MVFSIAMLTLGQIGFCLPQFLVRATRIPTYFPLAMFFIANGVIALGPAVFLLSPEWDKFYMVPCIVRRRV